VVQAASGCGIPLRFILASFVSHLLHPAAIKLFDIYQQVCILLIKMGFPIQVNNGN